MRTAPVLAALLALAALPATAQRVTCAPGERVDVVEDGTPSPATVRDGPRDGQCLVGYDGYGALHDEWVSIPALAPLGATAAAGMALCTKRALVEVRDYGTWYPAVVIAPPRDGTCLIHYEGFESTQDAWVTGDRIRARLAEPPPEPLSAELAAGQYVCFAGLDLQILHPFSFQVLPGGRTADPQGGNPGTYFIDTNARAVAFVGGPLGGTIYAMTGDSAFAITDDTGYVVGTCGPL